MQATSLEAYAYVKYEAIPDIGERQKIVLNHIRGSRYPITDREIAKELGYKDPNSVRPRRYELVEMGLVEEACRRKCHVTGRKAIAWAPKAPITIRRSGDQKLYERGFQRASDTVR